MAAGYWKAPPLGRHLGEASVASLPNTSTTWLQKSIMLLSVLYQIHHLERIQFKWQGSLHQVRIIMQYQTRDTHPSIILSGLTGTTETDYHWLLRAELPLAFRSGLNILDLCLPASWDDKCWHHLIWSDPPPHKDPIQVAKQGYFNTFTPRGYYHIVSTTLKSKAMKSMAFIWKVQ